MGIPYERIVSVVVDDADLIYPVDFPSNIFLTKIYATRHFAGEESVSGSDEPEFTIDVYSRAFTRAAQDLVQMEDVSDSTGLTFVLPHRLKVGDTVEVTGNANALFDGTHVVTELIDTYRVVTDQVSTGLATGRGGIATLAIPEDQYPNYEVISQQTAVNGVVRWSESHGQPYENQDPVTAHGAERMLYFKFSRTGTYLLTIACFSDWGV